MTAKDTKKSLNFFANKEAKTNKTINIPGGKKR